MEMSLEINILNNLDILSDLQLLKSNDNEIYFMDENDIKLGNFPTETESTSYIYLEIQMNKLIEKYEQ